MTTWEIIQKALPTIQVGLTAVTTWIILKYTIETRRIRTETVKQTQLITDDVRLSAFVEIHKILANRISYEIRWYLHTQFADDLANATLNTLGSQSIGNNGKVETQKVLNSLPLQRDDIRLRAFNEALERYPTRTNNINALQAVEWALLDFDIIAVPLCMEIESVKKIAKAYKPVLERTAEKILPFVAIQRQLRGDLSYKRHYLKLLQSLGIPLQGLEVPEEED